MALTPAEMQTFLIIIKEYQNFFLGSNVMKKHAELNKTTRDVERACNRFVVRATSFECPTRG